MRACRSFLTFEYIPLDNEDCAQQYIFVAPWRRRAVDTMGAGSQACYLDRWLTLLARAYF
jgi:hypothetical protein